MSYLPGSTVTELLIDPSNATFPWDSFDSEQYVQDNYEHMLEDDARILQKVRDHFLKIGPVGGAGIDVGAGANLYPTLAMLPFCDSILLYERSLSNRRWLMAQLPNYAEVWDQYWGRLAPREPLYSDLAPRERVRQIARVQKGDIFGLPQKQWRIGTMFFVAESITPLMREFNSAIERFLGALKPGAPFAAAFMQESRGYTLGKVRFPAVPVTVTDVEHSLERHVDDFTVERVFSGQLLRPDYRGMILALGRAGRAGKAKR